MPFVAIDHTVAFAIDAPIKASDQQQMDQNVDHLKARMETTTGHTHDQSGGADQGGPITPADNSVTQAKIADAAVGIAELKFSQGSWSGSIGIGVHSHISLGDYAHPHKVGASNHVNIVWGYAMYTDGSSSVGTSIGAIGYNSGGTSVTGHITWYYHNS